MTTTLSLHTTMSQTCMAWRFLNHIFVRSSEGNFQAVLARSSVSSWVGFVLPDPVLHTGQLYRRTLTFLFGRHGLVVWAQIADFDKCTSGVHHLLSVCMEQSPGWFSWSRAQSLNFQTSTQDLFVKSFWLLIFLAAHLTAISAFYSFANC